MARTTAHIEVPAPRKRAQMSQDTSEAPAGEKRVGRPSTSGTRKRVNIDSLASRLGAEVVRELEALIIPGSKEMPSFTARQAIQKKYSVNRRHIYDWYHTKGLRVTREESRSEGAGATLARPQRDVRQRGGPSSTPDMTFDASEDGDSSFSSPNPLMTPAHHGNGPFSAYGEYSTFNAGHDAPPNNWYYYYGPPGHGQPDFQHKHPLATSASTTPIIPATVKTPYMGASANSHGGRPIDTTGRAPANDQDENVEPGLPPDLSGLLSGSERQALYDSLSGILGPPNGIEESVGTYKAYMQRQSQIYYETLLPSPASSSIAGYNTSVASPAVLRAPQAGLDVSSLPHQSTPGLGLSTPYTLQPVGFVDAQGVSRHHQYGNRKLSGGSTPANPNIGSVPPAYPGTPTSTRMDLSRFGTPYGYARPALELGDILESPLLRSRNPSMVAHGHALYAVNPAQAPHVWYPAQTFVDATGRPVANPAYHPAMPTPVPAWQPPYMPPVLAPPADRQWERGSFTAMLQDAMPAPAETTAPPGSGQRTNKDMRQDSGGQHVGRTRTTSRGA